MHAGEIYPMPEGLAPGAMVNQYRIVTCLGSGGMGDVCLAEDTFLNRKVALKFLAGAYLTDENSRARFIREARAAAALNHPNIITVYEVGEYRGRPYIAMELVEGKTLREMIPETGMDIHQVVSIASQICEGLAEAHRKGLIHRDIKPANIMIDTNGRARILDFGLARSEKDPKVTQSGTTPGTTAYVSPEQVKGEAATVASDLFSLGVLMYQMLTGRLPFGGEYDASILYAIVNEIPPAPSTIRPEVPSQLDIIVNRLLEKDPHQRFGSASEIRDALDDLSKPLATKTPTTSSRDWLTRRLWYTVALIIVALGLGIGLPTMLKLSHAPAPVTERKMIAVLPFQNMGPAEDEYFADGMTDAITQHLAKFSGLGVISRSSSMLYKHSDKTPDEIGMELGAGYLLTGSIHWDKSQTPNRIKINTALIRVGERADIWDETYERNLEKLFALQSEVATDVTRALQVTIGRNDRASLKAKPTDNLDAYDFYLRGNDYFYRTWEQADIQSAVQMYQRAVALDSNFALAWAM
ncbi:MAG TPA: serine/threonine-protein kinase, partial [Candidatus Acidoferrum sp.]|nr:serine/threonine-protein kinase [Candidatus Acidoferrum sp.]